MPLMIRPVCAADADIVADFNARMALETENKHLEPDTVRAGVAAMIADPAKGFYFVAEIEGAIVGQLGVTREWSDWRNGDFWWIQSVYVTPHARRQGVFASLYRHVLQAALTHSHVIGVRLYVEHDNHAAQATYKKMGMAMTSYQVMEACWINAFE